MRNIDLLILGATGFTGRFVVERLVQTIQKYQLPIRWAVAARNTDGLKKNLGQVQSMTGVDMSRIPIYSTDIDRPESLDRAFRESRLVLNCIGPYSLFGEPVLRSCIQSGAHYMDLCGEPLFLERMQLQYDQMARERGVCAVGSCGFDSIPSDIGVQYLKTKFDGRMNHAEVFLQVQGGAINYATWRAMVEGYRNRHQLAALRKQLFSRFAKFKWPVPLERKNFKRIESGYCVPFPGSDRSVVNRSQLYRYTHYNGEPPAKCEAYFLIPEILVLLKLVAMNVNLTILTRYEWGTRALLRYSKYFSFGIFAQDIQPTRESLESRKFWLTIVGHGWPSEIKPENFTRENMTQCKAVKISGGDLAYIDTSTIAVQTALALLDRLDGRGTSQIRHGVLTPAAAFEPEELVPRLIREGIGIEFIPKYKNF